MIRRLTGLVCVMLLVSGWKFVLLEAPESTGSGVSSPELMEADTYHRTQYFRKAFDAYQAAARSEDPLVRAKALLELANMHRKGLGTEKNVSRFVALLRESSELGNRKASLRLAETLHYGQEDTPPNPEAARQFYTLAAEEFPEALIGLAELSDDPAEKERLIQTAKERWQALADQKDTSSMRSLARLYEEGTLVEKDVQRAEQYYRNAIAAGDVKAAVYLAKLWEERRYRKDAEKDALALMLQVAERGDIPAMLYVADAYTYGRGTERDIVAAYQWYDKASQLGSLEALIHKSVAQYFGWGTTQNEEAARQVLEQAANTEPELLMSVAESYAAPYEDKDMTEATIFLYQVTAAQNYAAAMTAIGDAYTNGIGVTRNPKEAMQWYGNAADAGEPNAMIRLAKAHIVGLRLSQDVSKSIAWFRRAAEQNHPEAQYQLGLAYARGFGIEQDMDQAHYWFEQARSSGYPLTDEIIQIMEEAAVKEKPSNNTM